MQNTYLIKAMQVAIDSEKVLATVVAPLYAFTDKHPDAYVLTAMKIADNTKEKKVPQQH